MVSKKIFLIALSIMQITGLLMYAQAPASWEAEFNALAKIQFDAPQLYTQRSKQLERLARQQGDSFWAKRFRIRVAHGLMIENKYDSAKNILIQLKTQPDVVSNNILLAELLLDYGQILEFEAKPAEAAKQLLKSAELFEKAGMQRNVGINYYILIKIFTGQKNYPEAKNFALKALDIFQKEADDLGMTRVYTSLGNISKYENNITEALKYHQKALEIARRINSKTNIAIALDNLGTTYLAMNDSKKALEVFLESLKIQEKMNLNNGLIIVTYNIGLCYQNLGDLKNALKYYEQSFKLAQKDSLPEDMYYATQSMADIHYLLGNYKLAFEYLRQHLAYKDTIFNKEQNQTLNDLMAKYESDKKEQALNLQKAEIKAKEEKLQREKLVRYGLISGLLVFGILTVMLVRTVNARNKYARQLEAQQQELLRLNQLKDKLFAIISHDLRQPVASVYMTLELLMSQPQPSSEMIKRCHLALQGTLDLINNLLYWSQMQLKRNVLPPKATLEIDELLQEIIEPLQLAASQKQIQILMEGERNLQLSTDKSRLSIIVRNLLSNAIKFAPPASHIRVVTHAADGHFTLSVIDQGPGLTDEVKQKIFGGITTLGSMGESGTGLGLTLCKELSELLGGSIQVHNMPEGGACFTVSLPMA